MMFDDIPNGWFLWSFRDERTPVSYAGDTHKHIRWVCELQHENGGRLCLGSGSFPAAAIKNAIDMVRAKYADRR